MDWLRRNWPDMLIGLALVAVIAGIVATLLTGGSFFPLGSGGTTVGTGNDVASPPPVSVPRPDRDGAGQEAGAPAESGGLAGPGADGPEVAVGPRDDAADADGGLAAPDAGPPGAPDGDVTAPSAGGAQPLAPGDEPAAAAAGSADPAGAVDEDATPEPIAAPLPSQTDEVVLPSPEEESEGAAANASLPTDPFRVSVGAFGDAANAERQADRFRAEGYPVFIGRQGEFHIVLVGPYADESEARGVAGEIDAGDFGIDPVIYRFQPDGSTRAGTVQAVEPPTSGPAVEDAGGEASAGEASAGEASAGEASADDAAAAAGDDDEAQAAANLPAVAAITSNDGRLLQVGAYADVESAQPQVQRLESLGLTARRLQESDMVKLVVGPLSGEALEDAQVVLEGAGIEYFAR